MFCVTYKILSKMGNKKRMFLQSCPKIVYYANIPIYLSPVYKGDDHAGPSIYLHGAGDIFTFPTRSSHAFGFSLKHRIYIHRSPNFSRYAQRCMENSHQKCAGYRFICISCLSNTRYVPTSSWIAHSKLSLHQRSRAVHIHDDTPQNLQNVPKLL